MATSMRALPPHSPPGASQYPPEQPLKCPAVTRRRLTAAIAGLVLATTLGLAACSSGSDSSATPTDPVLARGQDVYKKNCATCHGSKGGGGAGVKLAGVVASRYPNIEDHENVIRNGIQPGMPAWGQKLSDDDIQAVARWEREGF
jgi:mono/diheme cytochrome c family protein